MSDGSDASCSASSGRQDAMLDCVRVTVAHYLFDNISKLISDGSFIYFHLNILNASNLLQDIAHNSTLFISR